MFSTLRRDHFTLFLYSSRRHLALEGVLYEAASSNWQWIYLCPPRDQQITKVLSLFQKLYWCPRWLPHSSNCSCKAWPNISLSERLYLSKYLGCLPFDFTFQYVLAGWAGSVHDSRILDDAKKRRGLISLMGSTTLQTLVMHLRPQF